MGHHPNPVIPPAVVILVPVLNRPHRVKPLLASIKRTTPTRHRVLFLVDPDDQTERQAIAKTDADWTTVQGGYATKINTGVRCSSEPLIMTAADDVIFHPGWLAEAYYHIACHNAQVVGTNDLCSDRVKAGQHATHFLITREYAEQPCIDGSPGPLAQVYTHSAVDDELVATARKRRVLAFATDSIVEHQHPDNGTAEWDTTYEKGRRYIRRDLALFRRRKRRYGL